MNAGDYKPVTIKDIAEKANVSVGTVDRVLHKRGKVAPLVEERVLKIINDLEYEPNFIARALKTKKDHHIACIIPDDKKDPYWEDPKSGIIDAVQNFKQFGIKVSFFHFNPNSAQSFIECANEASKENVNAILISPIFHNEVIPFFDKWNKMEIPVICINTEISDYKPLNYIGQDSYQSGYLAGKLIHYGLAPGANILIIHFDEEFSNSDHLEKKESGFRNYFRDQHLDAFKIISANVKSEQESDYMLQMDSIFNSENIQAVYVTTSKSFVVAKYIKQKKLDSIRIVGYDLVKENLKYLQENMISFLINQNPKGQGYGAINLLAEQLIYNKEIPSVKYLPLDIVTHENASYFI